MKIPKSVMVKGEKWTVRLVEDLHDEGDKVDGLTTYEGRLIEVEASLSPWNMKQIFWHEVGHAIIWEAHLSGNTGGLSDIVEEVICDSFGDFLADHADYKSRRGKRK